MRLSPTSLERELVWVHLLYPDKSEFCFQTTLSPSILNTRDIILEPGKLVRLDKKYYIDGSMQYKQYDPSGAKVSVWSEEQYFDSKNKELSRFL